MKHKIPVILGMVMLVSLLVPAAPASAGTAAWSAELMPRTIDNVLGPAGVDVRDMAVASSTTIYAVPGDSISDNVVYKSTDTGVSWTTLNANIEADLIAVAPDDANLIAIANNGTAEVRLTTDGGSTWYDLGIPQESGGGTAAAAINDLAISPASEGIHYVAAAGKETGNVANTWYFDAGAVAPVWHETNDLAGFSSASEVKAVAFSPSFSSDLVMVAISIDSAMSVKLQMFSFNYSKWNSSANFASYPLTIISGGGITGLISASISPAPDYLASDSTKRIVFVGLAVNGATTSGIYRLSDTTITALYTGNKIHSIAYDGTNLIAGGYDATTVYRSSDPLATTPTVSGIYAMRGPGGDNRVVVAWAGSKVVAGTSGNESAFAVSSNNGASFKDISLIDTAITYVRDAAVSADGSKIYMVTDDGSDLSLWRKVSAWERILSQQGTTDYIVRLAPDNADVVYVAKKGATTIYVNKSGGTTQWYARTCTINVQDLAVESTDVAYALNSAGSVSRTADAGFSWGTTTATGLNSGATIVSISTNNLMVGSQDGYVAYSTNANSTWTEITSALQSGAGNVQLIADTNFDTNSIIYAASDTAGQNILKWQIGTSNSWTDILTGTVAGGIYGLAMDSTTLYALEYNASTGQSKLWQCLSPTSATSTSDSWSSSATTATTDTVDSVVHLNATPRALKASSGKLWAVKTNGTNKLYSFTDVSIEVTQSGPASGFINPVNAITGIADDIIFRWARSGEATKYELQIAYDSDFAMLVTTVTVESEESSVYVPVGPYQTGNAYVNYQPGTSYYWRVRTIEPLYGLYSTALGFSTKPLGAAVPDPLTPANGSTGVSRKPAFSWNPITAATEYQFVLSGNATLIPSIVDTRVNNAGFTLNKTLEYGSTYFWQVRATEPVQSDWSTLAYFTVREEPVEITIVVPPVIVKVIPSPPPVINAPEPPAANIVTIPAPPVTPTPTVPNYALIVFAIAAALLLVVIALIIITKGSAARPVRVPESPVDSGGFGGLGRRLGNLREGLVNYFRDFNPLRRFREVSTPTAGTAEAAARHPVSFAAESFLWMTKPEEKEASKRLLSADEEQALGKTLASRIQALAKDQYLYQKYPQDAALFLYLWSHYGSRDETNRYLTDSFQSHPENAVRLLRCYLTAPRGEAPGLGRKTVFSRTQYDSVAKVVDPDSVYEALTKLYGPELDRIEDGDNGHSSDKAIASQFARIHQRVKSEEKKTGRTGRRGKAGMVGVDTR